MKANVYICIKFPNERNNYKIHVITNPCLQLKYSKTKVVSPKSKFYCNKNPIL